MIHSVAVSIGESSHSVSAQEHAIAIAKLFGARMRAVGIWEAEAPRVPSAAGAVSDQMAFAQRALEDLLRRQDGRGSLRKPASEEKGCLKRSWLKRARMTCS